MADTHYTPEHLWENYEASKEWQEAQVHTEKTGLNCAKWLVNYCNEIGRKLPSFLCHSMNPVGKDKIISTLERYNEYWKDCQSDNIFGDTY